MTLCSQIFVGKLPEFVPKRYIDRAPQNLAELALNSSLSAKNLLENHSVKSDVARSRFILGYESLFGAACLSERLSSCGCLQCVRMQQSISSHFVFEGYWACAKALDEA